MQSEKVNIWDALSHGGWDEAMNLNRRGMLDSPLYNKMSDARHVNGIYIPTDPLNSERILDYFGIFWTGADNMIMEYYDYLDTFTPEEFVNLLIRRKPSMLYYYEVVRNYFVEGLKSGKISRERFERIITLILNIKNIKTSAIVLVDSLFVKLILEGIYTEDELLSFVPDSLEYEIRIPIRMAFSNLGELCNATKWYNLDLLLLTAIEVSGHRLEQLVRAYYSCGGSCESIFNHFVEDFIKETQVSFSKHTLRTIERAIIFNCDKSLIEYDTKLLTLSAQQHLIELMESMPSEV